MSTTLCSKCGLACSDAEYIVHVANDCQTVSCPKCPQFYANAEKLLKHTRAVHDGEFQCTICDIRYASKFNLKRHLAFTHNLVDHEKHKCEVCGKVLVTKYFLKLHKQREHGNSCVCHLCEQELYSPASLRRHMLRKHKIRETQPGQVNVQRIDCPKCGKLIAKASLEMHIRYKHKETYTCHVCEKICPSEKALKKHIDCRHGEENSEEILMKKKYKCPHCPRRFTAGFTLRMHIRGIHEQEFQCEMCDRYFSALFPLMRHRENIHGLKPKSAPSKSKTLEDDIDVKEESEDEDDDEDGDEEDEIPSTSQPVKVKEESKDDQKPTIDELKGIKIKAEIS